METFIVLNIVFYLFFAFVLMGLGVFAVGFFIGYKSEDKKILKKKQQKEMIKTYESEKEIKAKKEWKKFLEYDGSAPSGAE